MVERQGGGKFQKEVKWRPSYGEPLRLCVHVIWICVRG